MPVTIKDVAKLAGVSNKTVSRVINNQAEISAETRARVKRAIEKLGYRPNILARSLVNRRTDTLAVVAWGIELFGPSHAVVGIESQADDLGYSLFLNLGCAPDDDDIAKELDMLVARRVDGIIWAIPEVGQNRKWAHPARMANLPPLVFLSMAPRPGLSTVAVNNHLGAYQATRHLIDCDRNQIGLITGPLTWWEAQERLAGWKQALTEAGLSSSASFVAEGDWSAASGERAMRDLLARNPRLDAVFCSNDQMALGALGVIHASGRRIPQDLSIVGFDDIPEAAFFSPSLTTVHQAMDDVGRTAVQSLHRLIEAKRQGEPLAPTSVLLDPRLVIRASSA